MLNDMTKYARRARRLVYVLSHLFLAIHVIEKVEFYTLLQIIASSLRKTPAAGP